MFRIGHGYDVHRFQSGDHITLGGVKIPFKKSIVAHSDGDVVIHAICDALLGAAALGDLGQHFPDNDDAYRNIDSRILLQKVNQLLIDQPYKIYNLDVTIVAEAPKVAPYVDTMRQHIAHDLATEKSNVSIKATTTEKMGFLGREEGIAAYAVVLIGD